MATSKAKMDPIEEEKKFSNYKNAMFAKGGNTEAGVMKLFTDRKLEDKAKWTSMPETEFSTEQERAGSVARQPDFSGETGVFAGKITPYRAKPIFQGAMGELFHLAEKSGLKTRDQFVAAYPDMVKTLKQRNKAAYDLLTDEKFKGVSPNVKDAAGQLYADIVMEVDAKAKAAPAPTSRSPLPAAVKETTKTEMIAAAPEKRPMLKVKKQM